MSNDLNMLKKLNDRTSSKMQRMGKVFMRVDREGLLTDSLSMSDVVNFDCYESIVGSAQRVVAAFNGVSPESITIEDVFYYKKRARSSRMNPVRLRHTTDGFRAVAEHPTGEVPLGVLWTKRHLPQKRRKVVVKVELEDGTTESGKEGGKSPDHKSANDDDVPEKRRRLESPSYKTYMPTSEDGTPSFRKFRPTTVQVPVATGTVAETTDAEPRTTPKPGKTLTNPQIKIVHPPQDATKKPTWRGLNTSKPDQDEEFEKRYQHRSQYQWPEDLSCEVIMSYDGITEKKPLIPGLAYVVQCLLKGNYSVLNREVAASLSLTKLYGSSNAQETLNEYNKSGKHMPKTTDANPTHRAPIKYLQDAKTEIFKVLSLLNLSKARFKQLLDWMKSLKLEEKNKGKFYLSERNVIGNGLNVTYDTNEEAAMKLNQIYKNRATLNAAKVLHPIDPYPTAPTPAATTSATGGPIEGPQKQMLLLLPKGGAGGTGELVNVQPTSMSVAQAAGMLNSTTVGDTVRTSQGLVQVRNSTVTMVPTPAQTHVVSTSVSQSQAHSQDSSTRTNTPAHSTPSILRRKTGPKTRNSSSPVPMHLFKSSTSETDSEHLQSYEGSEVETETPTPLFVKHEPVDYTSDTTEDFDKSSNKGLSPTALFGDAEKCFLDVLKADAQMPQSSEQNDKPFNIVIKSEPLDDYQ